MTMVAPEQSRPTTVDCCSSLALTTTLLLLLANNGVSARNHGDLSASALFSDGMVLQTSVDVPAHPYTVVHGTCGRLGETITLTGTHSFDASVSFPGSPYRSACDSTGRWSITVSDAEVAAELLANPISPFWGPYDVAISSGNGTSSDSDANSTDDMIVASDVYFGDVFLCSGQSNMEKTVNYIANSTEEIKAADGINHPFRLFQVPSNHPPGPNGPWHTPNWDDLKGSCLYCLDPPDCGRMTGKNCADPVREWVQANSSNVAAFSAICYLSVRDVQRLGDATIRTRPVGLIESDWGGTPIQAWTPPEGLAACGMPTDDCATEPHGNCSHYPSVLYNHMLYPLVGWGVRSILWYQGEANSDEGFPLSREDYGCVFGQMIDKWRDAWDSPALPFVWVQLSSWVGNWGFDNLPCVEYYCPVISRIRLAQSDVAGISPDKNATATEPRRHVGMAVSFDFGDNQQHGVHSRYKSIPAERVALQVLYLAYPASESPTRNWVGPLVKGATLRPPSREVVEIHFLHAEGLQFRNTTECENQYSKSCCGDFKKVVLGRICYMSDPNSCAIPADGLTVVLASFSIGADSKTLLATPAATGQTRKNRQRRQPKFIDFSLTDFPQCAIVDSDGLALGPFGPLEVGFGKFGVGRIRGGESPMQLTGR